MRSLSCRSTILSNLFSFFSLFFAFLVLITCVLFVLFIFRFIFAFVPSVCGRAGADGGMSALHPVCWRADGSGAGDGGGVWKWGSEGGEKGGLAVCVWLVKVTCRVIGRGRDDGDECNGVGW